MYSMPFDKAPGPDGFTGAFFKACWEIIKDDVMAAMNSLFTLNAQGFEWLNSASIILLPNKADATRVTDFRPISLVHGIAKIFSKVLANRLAPRLNSLVSNYQSAFIKKRSIHDNFLYVQGAVQRLHTQKIPALFMKLDIHKLLIRFIGGTCSRFYRLWASDTDGVNGSLSSYVHPPRQPCLMGTRGPLLAMPEASGREIRFHPCYSS